MAHIGTVGLTDADAVVLVAERKLFHRSLLANLLVVNERGVPGNADKDNKTSVAIAKHIANALQAETGQRLSAQSSGNEFEDLVCEFLSRTFTQLGHLRPGSWTIKKVGSRSGSEISAFSQYAHLAALKEATRRSPELAAVLGNDYAISPDVIVVRQLESDETINGGRSLIDGTVAQRADLRRTETNRTPILHASVSTKWTLRSDRAQNARSEALNLIRNRKGRQPHIVVVTGEPTPSRLASLCLGTGDIDCVYHFALPELIAAVDGLDNSEARDLLCTMVDGKRLKDISDLPLDLAV